MPGDYDQQLLARLMRLEEMARLADEWNRDQDRRMKALSEAPVSGFGGGGGAGRPALVFVRSPSGGIAPGATETCEEYDADDETVLTGSTFEVKNPYDGEPVPGSRKTWAVLRRGAYRVLNWECEPPEEEE